MSRHPRPDIGALRPDRAEVVRVEIFLPRPISGVSPRPASPVLRRGSPPGTAPALEASTRAGLAREVLRRFRAS